MAESRETIAIDIKTTSDPSGAKVARDALGNVVYTMEQYNRALVENGNDAIKAARSATEMYAAEQKVAQSTQQATTALNQQQQVVQQVAQKVDAATSTMNRAGMGALAMSRGFEMMARTGKETGASLDLVLQQVGMLAFGFGAQGALVGAIAIATQAIIELFSRSSAELEKFRQKFDRETESLMRSGSLLSVDAARQRMFSGGFAIREKGESDAQFVGRSQGLLGLGAEAQRINTEIDKIQNRKGLHFESDAKDVADLRDKLREVNALIGIMGTQWSQLGAREREELAIAERRAEIELQKKQPKYKDLRDPYKLPELPNFGAGFGQMGIPSDLGIPDPLKAIGDQLKANNAADVFEITKTVQDSLKSIGTMWFAKTDELAKQLAQRIATSIGSALQRGFAAAFEKGGNIGKGFAAMGGMLLESLGEVMVSVGEKTLAFQQLMETIKKAIAGLVGPGAGIAASLGMITLGMVTEALGARMMANSGGGFGGSGRGGDGYGGGGGTFTPTPSFGAGEQLQHITIIMSDPESPGAIRRAIALQRRAGELKQPIYLPGYMQ